MDRNIQRDIQRVAKEWETDNTHDSKQQQFVDNALFLCNVSL